MYRIVCILHLLPNPANANKPAYSSRENMDVDLKKNELASDNHNSTLKTLLAKAPIYSMLRRLAMTALPEKPKKINTADDKAKKMIFPDGSQLRKNDIKVDSAIPLKIEYAYTRSLASLSLSLCLSSVPCRYLQPTRPIDFDLPVLYNETWRRW